MTTYPFGSEPFGHEDAKTSLEGEGGISQRKGAGAVMERALEGLDGESKDEGDKEEEKDRGGGEEEDGRRRTRGAMEGRAVGEHAYTTRMDWRGATAAPELHFHAPFACLASLAPRSRLSPGVARPGRAARACDSRSPIQTAPISPEVPAGRRLSHGGGGGGQFLGILVDRELQ